MIALWLIPLVVIFFMIWGMKKEHAKTKAKGKGSRMTFYWASEPEKGFGTGDVGACDNKLVPMKSVAMREDLFYKYKGRQVHIPGYCEPYCVVADMCKGPGCQEFDFYVGTHKKKGYDGVPQITYTMGKVDPDAQRWLKNCPGKK